MVLLLFLLVAVPTLEIWLLLQVSDHIGVWPTVAILVLEAAIGGWLIRREGARVWQALVATFGSGRVPTGELADAALVLVGGLLLFLPGFATDVIGFLFLLPLTRPLARRLVAFFVARQVNRLAVPAAYRRGPGEVIEGETVDGPASEPTSGPLVIPGEVSEP